MLPIVVPCALVNLSKWDHVLQVGVATVGIFIYWYCFDEGTDGISTDHWVLLVTTDIY